MTTVFVGGSRQVSRLPPRVRTRLDKIVANGLNVVVGDANGVDKAIQKYLMGFEYMKVTVYHSEESPRNNTSHWPECRVIPKKAKKDFHFFATKDRKMAEVADFGLLIWDGESPGTVLNALRLVGHGKPVVLVDTSSDTTTTLKSETDFKQLFLQCSTEVQREVYDRATKIERDPYVAHVQDKILDLRA